MKRFMAFVLSILFFILGVYPTQYKHAFAEEFYGRAESDNVGFYSSEIDEKPMFCLPLGYYVYITGETENFYYCEYAKSESSYTKKYGFVKKSEIYIDDNMALPLFPEISLTAIKDTNLYSKTNKSTVLSSITAGQSAYFYGLYTDETETMYYVKISGDFGYVEASGFEQLIIPTHPKLLSFDEGGVSPTAEPTESPTESEPAMTEEVFELSRDIQIAMILCIAIPALVFIFYAFKPREDVVTRYFDS